jgi:hypothetical protein
MHQYERPFHSKTIDKNQNGAALCSQILQQRKTEKKMLNGLN